MQGTKTCPEREQCWPLLKHQLPITHARLPSPLALSHEACISAQDRPFNRTFIVVLDVFGSKKVRTNSWDTTVAICFEQEPSRNMAMEDDGKSVQPNVRHELAVAMKAKAALCERFPLLRRRTHAGRAALGLKIQPFWLPKPIALGPKLQDIGVTLPVPPCLQKRCVCEQF